MRNFAACAAQIRIGLRSATAGRKRSERSVEIYRLRQELRRSGVKFKRAPVRELTLAQLDTCPKIGHDLRDERVKIRSVICVDEVRELVQHDVFDEARIPLYQA